MLRNYIKIALRNIWKSKQFSAINLFGLASGMGVVILILLYVQHELSYDKYHEKKDRIFRLANEVEGASYENGIAKVAGPWGPAAKAEIPEIEEMTRFVFYGQALVGKAEDRYFEKGGFYTDGSVFDIFSYKMLEGDPKTALTRPNSIVLTETMAKKNFGEQSPLGKSITFNNTTEYQVTGLIEDVPANSHFTFPFLVSLNTYEHPDRADWLLWNQFYTYILLQAGVSPQTVADKFDKILARHLEQDVSDAYTPLLQPIASIHLHSKLHREMAVNSDVSYIYIFSAIALLILLIACTNFVNLTTARATHRAKEVGVRKVNGANRKALIYQFLGESFMLSLIAAVLGIMFAQILLPPMNTLLGTQLELDYLGSPAFAIGLLVLTILVALLSGSYPAFFLSSLKPVSVLKGRLGITGNAGLRKALVVFQFTISTVLIVSALVISRQLSYIQNKNLGFNKDQIITIPMRERETIEKAETIKEELLQHPGVLMVSASANQPGGSDYGLPYTAEGIADDQLPAMRWLVVDHEFLNTYEMEMTQGRAFSRDFPTDNGAFILNETAAKQFGWEDPIGKKLALPPGIRSEAGPIIGIVKDFHFHSLHEKISPIAFFIEPTWFSRFSVKLDAKNIDNSLAFLKEKWATIEPAYPFTYTFFDQRFDALHSAEQSTGMIIRWFTLLAILITCMGLFGLSTYTAERRTKEIGIRKVLGASVSSILGLMSKEVMLLIGVAMLLATPLAYWLMNSWLMGFAYNINITAGTFLIAISLTITIAFLTVGYHSVRTALHNPAKTLRYE